MQRKPTSSEEVAAERVEVNEAEETLPDEYSNIGMESDGGGPRLTPQQRAAARRELDRLLDKLVNDTKHLVPSPLSAGEPMDGALTPYRSPDRCVLQGADGAVSVSWFPAPFTDMALGELQVIEWSGVVQVRGATRRRDPSPPATIVHAEVYREVQTPSGWGWQATDAPLALSTDDLAGHCLKRVMKTGGSEPKPAA